MAQAAEAIPISSAHKPERNIYQRINAVMREVRGVEKSAFNPQGKFNYAGHEAVTEAVRDSFVKHGIVQTVSMLACETLEGGVVRTQVRVAWFCDDCPSSCIVSDSWAVQPCTTREGKFTAQQVGQAMSYAVKNIFFKQLMLTGDPERDSDAEPLESPTRRSEPPPANDADPARATAAELLARFGQCQTEAEITKANADIKAKWDTIKSVPGISDQIQKARQRAREQLKQREPGQEG